MAKMFKVSQSKAKTYRKCRMAYHYRYVDKLRKKVKARPLKFGSIVHEMIEAHANGLDPFKVLRKVEKTEGKMFRSERELYGDIIDDVRVIMSDYFNYWDNKDDLVYLPIGKKFAEHEFEIEIGKGLVFTGKIDAFVRKQSDKRLRFLGEHKSFGKGLPDEDERWRNVQAPVYTRAVEMLGWPQVDGVCWDYLRSKPPSAPQLLKNGKLAKRQIDTLPTKVTETLEELGVKPSEAKHLMAGAVKNQARYFQRIFTPTKPEVIGKVWSDFIETAQEMQDRHGKTCARTIDRHCSWCDYEPLCRAELRGGDVDFIKEKDYVHKDEEHEVNAE